MALWREISMGIIWRGKSTRAIAAGSATALPLGNLWAGDPAKVCHPSGNLVDHDLVGDAAQRGLLLNRRDRFLVEHFGNARRIDHRASDMDRLRGRQALHPGCDVDSLAEIILPFVEHDREAGTLMDADLDHEI